MTLKTLLQEVNPIVCSVGVRLHITCAVLRSIMFGVDIFLNNFELGSPSLFCNLVSFDVMGDGCLKGEVTAVKE